MDSTAYIQWEEEKGKRISNHSFFIMIGAEVAG